MAARARARPAPRAWAAAACAALLAALLAAVGGAAAKKAVAGAVELTDKTFGKSTSSGDTWFVKMYAPWCGHCKKLAPAWDELAREVQAEGINVGKVDCTQYKSLCSSKGVRGYPTLLAFKGGAQVGERYTGARDVPSLRAHISAVHAQ